MEPTNPELFSQPTNKVLRLEFLPSPGLTFEEHFNTNFKLDLDRYSYFVEQYAGTTRVSGYEVQKSGSDINVTAGVMFHKQFILKETTLSTVATFTAADMKLVLKITVTKKTSSSHPADINIVIGARTFSGPNQYTYAVSYLYTAGAVPSDTSTEFHIYLADISTAGVVTQKIELLADQRSWNFLKLVDTPDSYTSQGLKAIRVNTGATALEFFDAALAVHTHDDRYYTESEADALLATKSATGHTHDDRYFTESEVTTALAGKSDTGHTHDARYYLIADVDALLTTKAASVHAHTIANITDLQTTLDGKAPTSHTHTLITTTGFPTSYTASKWIRVNSGATAVEYFDAVDNFLALTDTPNAYSGSTQTGLKYIKVNAGGTALEIYDPMTQIRANSTNYNSYQVEFVSTNSTVTITPTITTGDATTGAALKLDLKVANPITALTAVPGFPSSFSGQKGKVVKTNTAENGVEFGPVIHDLSSSQEGSFLSWGKNGDTFGIISSPKVREITGRQGMGIDIVGTSQIAGDLVFKNSLIGPVLQDNTTNKSYRLTVVGGKLVLQQIQTYTDVMAQTGNNTSIA